MKQRLMNWGIAIASLLLAASCSNDGKMSSLLEQVPENADVVVVGNLKTIIESAGGKIENSVIKLPSYIEDNMSKRDARDFDDFNNFLKHSGVDEDACAMFLNYKDDARPIFLFALKDKSDFIKAIEDEKFREKDNEDGVVFYSKKTYEGYEPEYDDYSYIAIKGDYAYMIPDVWQGSRFKPQRIISRAIEDANDSNFGSTTFGDYITQGNAAGAAIRIPREVTRELKSAGLPSDIASLYEGVICLKGNLSDDKAVVEAKLFDEDGKEKNSESIKKLLDPNAKISNEALEYIGVNEQLVIAASLKDFNWDYLVDIIAKAQNMSRSDKAQINVVTSYLSKIDGTIALGFGLTNGLESAFAISEGINPMSNMSATIVVQTKDGKARSLVNDLKGLMDSQEVPYNDASNGFSVEIPEQGTIYVEHTDNLIVLSNHRIRKDNDNSAVRAASFSDYISAGVLLFDRNNKLMRDLGINNDIQLTWTTNAEKAENTYTLEVKGGKDSNGVIAKIAKIVTDIIGQQDNLNEKYKDFRRANGLYVWDSDYDYDDYDDYDDPYMVADSAVAVEEAAAY